MDNLSKIRSVVFIDIYPNNQPTGVTSARRGERGFISGLRSGPVVLPRNKCVSLLDSAIPEKSVPLCFPDSPYPQTAIRDSAHLSYD